MNISNLILVIIVSALISLVTTGIVLFAVSYFSGGDMSVSNFWTIITSENSRKWIGALSGWAAALAAIATILILINQTTQIRKGNELGKLEYITNCKAFHHNDFRIVEPITKWNEFDNKLIEALKQREEGDVSQVVHIESILSSVEQLEKQRIEAVKFLPGDALSKRTIFGESIEIGLNKKKKQIDLFKKALNDELSNSEQYLLQLIKLKDSLSDDDKNYSQYVVESASNYKKYLGKWYGESVYPKHIHIQQTIYGVD